MSREIKFRALLHGCINQYGITSNKTVITSQRLDRLIVRQQRELINK